MEIRDLRYLTASADAGTFARAAKALGLNSSTISRRIGRVEEELGLTLFERGRFGIRLTTGGQAVLMFVRRALADIDAVMTSGHQNGTGKVGKVRLGVRMPPIGEPMRTLLSRWREMHPDVLLTIFEMNERDIQVALADRRLDAALMTSHTLWPHATSEPLYRERIVAALPQGHPLSGRRAVDWDVLRDEIFLVQGWDESQSAREFYAAFLGSGVKFHMHAASKQSVFALVGAGLGVTLATVSQSEVVFPGVVYRPIDEEDAWLQVELAWIPDAEDAVLGRFLSFMRDESRSRHLLRQASS
ncbi:MAG: LysR family transcriptional regulator [Rhizobiales bacterium 65-79]|jgi:DNA-binding transcriptional LysR family regulator|nr:LysR family transcriptional regulator [Hyphomicrobiales bacterium]MBN9078475.1 LysR family transcriptional regulator [Hyphomicrobiales bacterium]OJT99915.1 MAG: LysR family transcriptional regulator [Rhizobiales bacterium 65-79]